MLTLLQDTQSSDIYRPLSEENCGENTYSGARNFHETSRQLDKYKARLKAALCLIFPGTLHYTVIIGMLWTASCAAIDVLTL
jgi:hypothetical protein